MADVRIGIDASGAERGARVFRRSAEDVRRSTDRAADASEELAESLDDVGDEAKRAGRGLDDVADEADDAGRSFNRTQRVGRTLRRSLIGITAALIGIAAAFAAVAIPSALAVAQFRNFDSAMREVSTLLGGVPGEMDLLTSEVLRLSGAFGTAPVEQASAFYQGISAGASNASDAVALLTTSNRLAIGGVTSVATAVDGLTTVVNAYGLAMTEAEDVSDAMFTAVRLGKTTVDELSNAVGRVAPLASAAGLAFGDVFAALAALTASGLGTNEAVTGLRGAIQSLAAPVDSQVEAARRYGVEIGAAAIQTRGFQSVLQDVARAADGNVQVMRELVPEIEGATAILSLSANGGQRFTDALAEMETRAGATAVAFEKVNEGLDQQLNRSMTNLSILGIELGRTIGESLLPLIRRLNRSFEEWFDGGVGVARAIETLSTTLSVATDITLALAVVVGGRLVSAAVSASAAFLKTAASVGFLTKAMSVGAAAGRAFWTAIGGPIGLIVTLIGLLVAFGDELTALARKTGVFDFLADTIRQITLEMAALLEVTSSFVGFLAQLAEHIPGFEGEALHPLTAGLREVERATDDAVESLLGLGEAAAESVGGIGFGREDVDALFAGFSDLGDSLEDELGRIGEILSSDIGSDELRSEIGTRLGEAVIDDLENAGSDIEAAARLASEAVESGFLDDRARAGIAERIDSAIVGRFADLESPLAESVSEINKILTNNLIDNRTESDVKRAFERGLEARFADFTQGGKKAVEEFNAIMADETLDDSTRQIIAKTFEDSFASIYDGTRRGLFAAIDRYNAILADNLIDNRTKAAVRASFQEAITDQFADVGDSLDDEIDAWNILLSTDLLDPETRSALRTAVEEAIVGRFTAAGESLNDEITLWNDAIGNDLLDQQTRARVDSAFREGLERRFVGVGERLDDEIALMNSALANDLLDVTTRNLIVNSFRDGVLARIGEIGDSVNDEIGIVNEALSNDMVDPDTSSAISDRLVRTILNSFNDLGDTVRDELDILNSIIGSDTFDASTADVLRNRLVQAIGDVFRDVGESVDDELSILSDLSFADETISREQRDALRDRLAEGIAGALADVGEAVDDELAILDSIRFSGELSEATLDTLRSILVRGIEGVFADVGDSVSDDLAILDNLRFTDQLTDAQKDGLRAALVDGINDALDDIGGDLDDELNILSEVALSGEFTDEEKAAFRATLVDSIEDALTDIGDDVSDELEVLGDILDSTQFTDAEKDRFRQLFVDSVTDALSDVGDDVQDELDILRGILDSPEFTDAEKQEFRDTLVDAIKDALGDVGDSLEDEIDLLNKVFESGLFDDETEQAFRDALEAGLIKAFEDGATDVETRVRLLNEALASGIFDEDAQTRIRAAFTETLFDHVKETLGGTRAQIRELNNALEGILDEETKQAIIDRIDELNDPLNQLIENVIEAIDRVDFSRLSDDAGLALAALRDILDVHQEFDLSNVFASGDLGDQTRDALFSSRAVLSLAQNFGTAIGEAAFGREAQSNYGQQFGLVLGQAIGGPLGGVIGSLVGSIGDVLFGGDGLQRVTLGANIAGSEQRLPGGFGDADRGGETGRREIFEETDSGLQIRAIADRTTGAQGVLDRILDIDDALSDVVRNATELDFGEGLFQLRDLGDFGAVGGGRAGHADQNQGQRGTFIGFEDNVPDGGVDRDLVREQLDAGLEDFADAWLDAFIESNTNVRSQLERDLVARQSEAAGLLQELQQAQGGGPVSDLFGDAETLAARLQAVNEEIARITETLSGDVVDPVSERVATLVENLTGSVEEIAAGLAAAFDIDRLLDLDVVNDTAAAADILDRANRTVLESYRRSARDVGTFAGALDGSAASLTDLASALETQKVLALDLVRTYRDLGDAIADNISSVRDSVEESLLSEVDILGRRRERLGEVRDELVEAIDPEDIERLTSEAVGLAQEIFRLQEESLHRQNAATELVSTEDAFDLQAALQSNVDATLGLLDAIKTDADARIAAGLEAVAAQEEAVRAIVDAAAGGDASQTLADVFDSIPDTERAAVTMLTASQNMQGASESIADAAMVMSTAADDIAAAARSQAPDADLPIISDVGPPLLDSRGGDVVLPGNSGQPVADALHLDSEIVSGNADGSAVERFAEAVAVMEMAVSLLSESAADAVEATESMPSVAESMASAAESIGMSIGMFEDAIDGYDEGSESYGESARTFETSVSTMGGHIERFGQHIDRAASAFDGIDNFSEVVDRLSDTAEVIGDTLEGAADALADAASGTGTGAADENTANDVA